MDPYIVLVIIQVSRKNGFERQTVYRSISLLMCFILGKLEMQKNIEKTDKENTRLLMQQNSKC